MSKNVKRERSKKEQKGSRMLGKNMREPRGRKKPDDNQELSMALFQVAFLPECLVIFHGGMPGMGGGMPGMAGMPGLNEILSDPEVLAAIQDPEVMVAFQDVAQNPASMSK
ncbi:hypothetical protein E2I00_011986 [Balaenoptera physalus]|uniref:STI1 domain-containing protein n=1 Tax=Balaenoptera physalus TaxID=9770 RepID=A0A643BQ50_BALPH|nr:hypothetical protein E2I00_011986 [Balaenoptera physalus]